MLNNEWALLQRLSRKLFFTLDDLISIGQKQPGSMRVLVSRYCKKGVFIRLKKGVYTLAQNWQVLSQTELFQLANFLQVPSYVSLTTALGFYGITTQVQPGYIENCGVKRTVQFEIEGRRFVYYKLKKSVYFSFIKKDGFFIATPEKALIDALYLYSFGKYRLDFAALDLNRLNKRELQRIVRVYPVKTRKVIEKLCGI